MKRLLLILMSILLLSSCVKDEGAIDVSDDEDWKGKPDMSLTETDLTLYDDENDPISVHASKAEFWSDEERAELTGFTFEQKDSDGNITMRGSAESAEVDTGRNVFTLMGNITLESVRDGLEIRCMDRVTFDADTEEITAPGEVEVLNDGSFFSGRGFYGNLKKEEYSFEKIMEGRFDV